MSSSTPNASKVPRFLSNVEVSNLIHKYHQIEKEDSERAKHSDDPNHKFSTAVARRPSNDRFNRYSNIHPYDYNRVKLQTKRNYDDKSDYINASYITALGNVRRYIATQGPLENTIDDFWLMVWEQNSAVIVMLAKEKENNRTKCSKYWPLDSNSPREFPEIGLKVALESEELDPITSSIVRTMRITKTTFCPANSLDGVHDSSSNSTTTTTTESRRVTQLQLVGWPDHGVPDSPDVVLKLVEKTNELQEMYTQQSVGKEIGPPVVHCSAGCGRTGTFCTVDSALALLPLTPDDSKDLIFDLVSHFREERRVMVQTMGQYQYCYLAVLNKLVSTSNNTTTTS